MSVATGPNVVLVVLDSARADALADAPTFTDLAGRGARFERAIAPAGWTIPSHVSMFSGLEPTRHGAIATGTGVQADLANARAKTHALADGGNLLAPLLQHAGVATFSSSPNPWVGPGAGLDAGFAEKRFFKWLDPRATVTPPPRLDSRAAKVMQVVRAMRRHAAWVRSGRDKGAEVVLECLDDFFSTSSGPFFAFVNLIETHEPHYPHASERTRAALHPRSLAETANIVLQPGLVRLLRMRAHNWGGHRLPDSLVERWKQAYAAEVRYVDRWLGRLMESLARVGHADDTVVIVTGDHGESFGEGGIVGHGLSVREPSVRVPLALWGPGIPTEVETLPVSLLSIRATVEHLMLGTDDPRSVLNGSGRGSAQVEIEDPARVSRPPRKHRRVSLGPGAAFYDGDLKLAIDPFEGRRLLDLARDPGEAHDLSGQQDPTPRQLEALKEWEGRVTRDA
jgi:arylsulfatase A-like enzyme